MIWEGFACDASSVSCRFFFYMWSGFDPRDAACLRCYYGFLVCTYSLFTWLFLFEVKSWSFLVYTCLLGQVVLFTTLVYYTCLLGAYTCCFLFLFAKLHLFKLGQVVLVSLNKLVKPTKLVYYTCLVVPVYYTLVGFCCSCFLCPGADYVPQSGQAGATTVVPQVTHSIPWWNVSRHGNKVPVPQRTRLWWFLLVTGSWRIFCSLLGGNFDVWRISVSSCYFNRLRI